MNKIIDIVIIGCGGNSIDIYEFINDINRENKIYNIIGFLDDTKHGENIIGTLKDVHKYKKRCKFIFAIGSEHNFKNRKVIIEKMNLNSDNFVTIIHPKAYVSSSAIIGNGVLVYPFVSIHNNVKVDDFCWILSNSVLNHNCYIGELCVICSCVNILGDVLIENGNFIGASTTILNNCKISEANLIGAGSIITKSIFENGIYYGNPAKKKIK